MKSAMSLCSASFTSTQQNIKTILFLSSISYGPWFPSLSDVYSSWSPHKISIFRGSRAGWGRATPAHRLPEMDGFLHPLLRACRRGPAQACGTSSSCSSRLCRPLKPWTRMGVAWLARRRDGGKTPGVGINVILFGDWFHQNTYQLEMKSPQ